MNRNLQPCAYPLDLGEPELEYATPTIHPHWPECLAEITGTICGQAVPTGDGEAFSVRRVYRSGSRGERRIGEFWACDLLVAEYLESGTGGEYVQQVVPVLIPTAALPVAYHRQRIHLRARIWREELPYRRSHQLLEAFSAEPLEAASTEPDRIHVVLRGRISGVTSAQRRGPLPGHRHHRFALLISDRLASSASEVPMQRVTAVACQVSDDVPGRSWLLRRGNEVVVRGRLALDQQAYAPRGLPPTPVWRVDVRWVEGESGLPLTCQELALLPQQIHEYHQRRIANEQQRTQPKRSERKR